MYCARDPYDGGGEYAAAETVNSVSLQRFPASGSDGAGWHARRIICRSTRGCSLLCATRGRFDLGLSLTTPPYVGWTLSHALGLQVRRYPKLGDRSLP